MKIDYGTSKKTKILDEHGSTVVTTTQYRAGIPFTTNQWIIREPIMPSDIKIDTLSHKLQELMDDPNKINPGIALDAKSTDKGTKYYVLLSYTLLEIE